MPGGLSDYTAERMLNRFMSITAYTPAATHYFALFTTNPVSGGAGYVELGDAGYARVGKTNNNTTWKAWGAVSAGAKHIGVSVTFGAATENWTEVVGVGIFDASSAGNLLAWGVLETPKTILDTETLVIPVDGGSITFLGESSGDGGPTDYTAARLMNYEFGITAYTPAANHWFGFFTTYPDPDGTGSVESSGGGYGRIAKVNNDTTWPAWDTGFKSNGVEIAHAAFTADMDTIVGAGWWDAESAGNLLWWGKFATPRTPLEDETLTLPVASGTFGIQ